MFVVTVQLLYFNTRLMLFYGWYIKINIYKTLCLFYFFKCGYNDVNN
jgi:hypothetical protein